MDVRPWPTRGGLAPGTDRPALWVTTAIALVGLVLTGAFTGTSPLARFGARTAAVAGGATLAGRPGPGPGQAAALRLLTKAARASRLASYHGVEVAWWGPGEAGPVTLQVWHPPGREALTAVTGSAGSSRPADGAGLDETVGRVLAGAVTLGLTQRRAKLLGANYTLAVTGQGSVAGRQASIVTVRRPGGVLAARLWVDGATCLPLRWQMFDSRARLVSDVRFWAITVGAAAAGSAPPPAAHAWGDTLAASQLARMRAEGWPLPGPLPGHLTLLSARENATPSGPVVDLDYSDGLSLVSIFVQRGHLGQLAGWSRVALKGHRVYSDDPDDRMVAWSAQGYVYTVISAAPPQTVSDVVAALPHDGRPDVFTRIRRGLGRMLSWVSP